MKKIFLGTVALVALAVPATAADLAARPYTKAPPPAYAPIYNWTGFYIGGHVGGAFGSSNNLFNSSSDNGRFLGGIQGGFDYQFSPNWVLGLEAQYSWMSDTTWVATDIVTLDSVSQRKRGLGSVTGRLGYTWGPGLLYVKGGYAFADISNAAVDGATGLPVAVNTNKDGWTVGAGLEYMFAPNWSAKIEYQYYDLGRSRTVFTSGPVEWRNDEHTVKAGINYRFNAAAPVMARY